MKEMEGTKVVKCNCCGFGDSKTKLVKCGLCNKWACFDSANESVDWEGKVKKNCCVRPCYAYKCKVKDICNKCRIGGIYCSKKCYDECS
jgi:hypothetical protein